MAGANMKTDIEQEDGEPVARYGAAECDEWAPAMNNDSSRAFIVFDPYLLMGLLSCSWCRSPGGELRRS
ncbi:hypothetical protein ACLOJK_015920 [Asimina triloba]